MSFGLIESLNIFLILSAVSVFKLTNNEYYLMSLGPEI